MLIPFNYITDSDHNSCLGNSKLQTGLLSVDHATGL